MDDLFSEFIKKLLIKKTTNFLENSENLKIIFNLKSKDLNENQKVNIVEKIYLISKNLEDINEQLNNLILNINQLNNLEIPIEISSQINEEIQFKENINELLPIYCYLLYLKLLDN